VLVEDARLARVLLALGEGVPDVGVLRFPEAGAHAEHDPAAADVIERAGHVGEQVGAAVPDRRHQRPELDPRRRLGPRAQHRPALEVLAGLVPAERPEVVPGEDDVRA
jgi:hypothetical protein